MVENPEFCPLYNKVMYQNLENGLFWEKSTHHLLQNPPFLRVHYFCTKDNRVLWATTAHFQSAAMLLIRSYVVKGIYIFQIRACRFGFEYSKMSLARRVIESFGSLIAHRFAAPWAGRMHSTLFERSKLPYNLTSNQ